ncbi:MAG: hypothetical protein WAO58_10320 [Fimbriimonadaceae bacterium]
MNSEFYTKLVDLYAARELTEELEEAMDAEAYRDPALGREMQTLRETVDLLRSEPVPDFTDVSYERILLKMYARGGDIQTRAPEPAHLQYHLPMAG